MTDRLARKFDQAPQHPWVTNSAKDSFVKIMTDALSPNAPSENRNKLPYYSTGGRSILRVGGIYMLTAEAVSWKVRYNTTPITTVDTQFPWDIDIGTCLISANVTNFVDPTKGPECDFMFHTMQSAAHAPMVELQVFDKLGNNQFFARGVFSEYDSGVRVGDVTKSRASFVGVAYQNFVAQDFTAYDGTAGTTGKVIRNAQRILGNLSGGIF